MSTIPFHDHKDSGGIPPFYDEPVGEQVSEFEFRLAPPIPAGTTSLATDPKFLISFDPTELQAYWQTVVAGQWQEPMPVDGVRRGDGPPPITTPTINDRLYVDKLNGDLYTAWDDAGTKQWLLVTAPSQLWQSLTGITSLISNPTSIQIDEATGEVGIGGAPYAGYAETARGNRLLLTVGGVDVFQYGQTGVGTEVNLGGVSYTNTNRFVELATQVLSPAGTIRMMVEIESDGMGGNTQPTLHYTMALRTVNGIATGGKATNLGSMAGIKSHFSHTATGVNVCVELPAGLPTIGARAKFKVLTNMATTPHLWTVNSFNALPTWALTNTITVQNTEIDLGIATVTQILSPIRTSGPQFIPSTTTLSATATSVIFSNAANATLTIPSAATVIGQFLYVGIWGSATASKFIAPSAGQIQVTPAGVTNNSVTITTSVVYQAASDGNWYIVG